MLECSSHRQCIVLRGFLEFSLKLHPFWQADENAARALLPVRALPARAGRDRLQRDGLLVPLTPKAFAMLLVLVRHSGSLVEKEFLMRALAGRICRRSQSHVHYLRHSQGAR